MSHRTSLRRGLPVALLLLLSCVSAPPRATPSPDVPSELAAARQLVVVTTPAWDSITGELRRYERTAPGAAWRAVGETVPIVVGRTGLAWGVGLDEVAAWASAGGGSKREGDGRSPAGFFPLRAAFGFAQADSAGWLRQP